MIVRLDLRRNSIGDKGLVALAHAFVDNVTLQQFWIWVRACIACQCCCVINSQS